MITISNSEMSTWDRCKRMWLALYYFGVAPAAESVTSNRLLGIRIHTALEGYYGYDLDPMTVLRVVYAIEIESNPEDAAELKNEMDMALAMAEGYLGWLEETGEDYGLRVVSTEQDFQIPMPGRDGVMLRSRLDQVLFRESDEALLYLDHKTATNFERHELMELDVQMPHYALMQKLAVAGMPDAPVIGGGALNTLRRVKRTSRSTPPYYRRDYFYFSDDDLATAWHRANSIVKEILEARSKLDWFFSRSPDMNDPANLEMLNLIQREHLRPTPMLNDCSWRCPLSQGLCKAMSDGSDWQGMLWQSGHWKSVDPYEYYRDDLLDRIRSMMSGKLDPDQEAGSR
jgi:hypothetical protein